MLVLTRKVGERVLIGERIVLEVLAIGRGQIRLGIAAPEDVTVMREELVIRERGYRPPGKPPPFDPG